MEIQVLAQALKWADAGPALGFMQDLSRDWHSDPLTPPARYGLIEDPSHLWLLAAHERPPQAHPDGHAGEFREELWRHDVAELFIAPAEGAEYLEFNLSPTGAWWMAAFDGPRQPIELGPLPKVQTLARATPLGGWQAALGIPLDWLMERGAWGSSPRGNVTLILESPDQRFFSAADLGGGEPDFHRPERFPKLRRIPVPRD